MRHAEGTGPHGRADTGDEEAHGLLGFQRRAGEMRVPTVVGGFEKEAILLAVPGDLSFSVDFPSDSVSGVAGQLAAADTGNRDLAGRRGSGHFSTQTNATAWGLTSLIPPKEFSTSSQPPWRLARACDSMNVSRSFWRENTVPSYIASLTILTTFSSLSVGLLKTVLPGGE